jgi:hypothetical protein
MPLTTSQNTVSSMFPASGDLGFGLDGFVTVLSCFLDRSFLRNEEHDDERRTLDIWGVDLNLVVAHVYPLIAAGNFLVNMRHYAGPNMREEDIGSLAANFQVVRIGAAIGSVLAGTCLLGWMNSTIKLGAVVWSASFSIALLVVANTSELILAHFYWKNSIRTFWSFLIFSSLITDLLKTDESYFSMSE